jgi:hypothetical protein
VHILHCNGVLKCPCCKSDITCIDESMDIDDDKKIIDGIVSLSERLHAHKQCLCKIKLQL